jgi:ATP-dependent Lon protease
MIDYEATLKENLEKLRATVDSYYEVADRPYPHFDSSVETWMSPEAMSDLMAEFTSVYYETAQEVVRSNIIQDRTKSYLQALKTQARAEHKLGSMVENYSEQCLAQLERLNRARYALLDRRDLLAKMLDAIRAGIYNIRPPV